MNQFVEIYQNLLDGVYFSFDRVAINCYFTPLQSPGGFMTWFQRYRPGKMPNKNELLRFAYRAARRLYAFAAAKKIKILTAVADERKHDVAETYLKNFDHLDWLYQHRIDNTRTRLRPAIISTIFGKDRRGVKIKSMSIEIENPEYDLTIISIWFGKNRIKIYGKGDRVLRVEVTINLMPL